jgi:hypothetical protein
VSILTLPSGVVVARVAGGADTAVGVGAEVAATGGAVVVPVCTPKRFPAVVPIAMPWSGRAYVRRPEAGMFVPLLIP